MSSLIEKNLAEFLEERMDALDAGDVNNRSWEFFEEIQNLIIEEITNRKFNMEEIREFWALMSEHTEEVQKQLDAEIRKELRGEK